MDRLLARCISDATIKDLKVDEIYKVEYTTDFKIIYNETDNIYVVVIIHALNNLLSMLMILATM